MGITQKDIAADLGISYITVNRAFNNSGHISDALRKRVLDYAKSKNYVPSRISQALVRNKVRTLALFSSSTTSYFWDQVENGIVRAADPLIAFNYNIHYHRIPDENTNAYVRILNKEIANGLEVAAFVYQRNYDMEKIFRITEKAGIPYITFNIDAPTSNRLCYIGCNYADGGRLVANFLGNALRFKKSASVLVIGFVEKTDQLLPKLAIFNDRFNGFLTVMREMFPVIKIQIASIHLESEKQYGLQIQDMLCKFEHKVDAVYLIPSFNEEFLQALSLFNYSHCITILHDGLGAAINYLESNLLTAIVYQDPFLQGYSAVKTLEYIIESKIRERINDVEIIHNLVFRENRELLYNHYAF
jgi:LacI family transcriptional regulator